MNETRHQESKPRLSHTPASPHDSRGLSNGWKFVILTSVLFVAYCSLGILVKMRREGARGMEAIPHLEMWKDLPFLVRDGVIFAVDTIKSKGRPGYDGL